MIKEVVPLEVGEELKVVQFNFPNPSPEAFTHRITFVARHGFYIRFESQSLKACHPIYASLKVLLSDSYNNDTQLKLCNGYSERGVQFESHFHTLQLQYQVLNRSVSSVLGRVVAFPGTIPFNISLTSRHSLMQMLSTLFNCSINSPCSTNYFYHYIVSRFELSISPNSHMIHLTLVNDQVLYKQPTGSANHAYKIMIVETNSKFSVDTECFIKFTL